MKGCIKVRIYSYGISIELNEALVCGASAILGRLLSIIGKDTFTDARYYPPAGDDPEYVARYFIFMVAIDHRTSRYRNFEGYVDGEFYHGADLLYRLGKLKYEENPDFFSPNSMANIGIDDVKNWLRAKGRDGHDVVIWDPDVRALLLRDLGRKLVKYYGGSVLNLIKRSGGYLKNNATYGFIDRLRSFMAYSDPVEKKAYLLAKFLSRRGILTYVDREHSEVPVDNHLTRIALRLSFIKLPEHLLEKMRKREQCTHDEDVVIRYAVRAAFKIVSKVINVDPLVLDDLLWLFGRHCCTRKNPVCVTECSGKCLSLKLCSSACPLFNVCPSAGSEEMLDEHYYVNTYYY